MAVTYHITLPTNYIASHVNSHHLPYGYSYYYLITGLQQYILTYMVCLTVIRCYTPVMFICDTLSH